MTSALSQLYSIVCTLLCFPFLLNANENADEL